MIKKYTEEGLQRLKAIIERQEQDYEILIDDEVIVPRTDNYDSFFDFQEFIEADSESVTIKIYKGSSNRNSKYIFRFETSLNGIDMQREKAAEAPNLDELKKQIKEELEKQAEAQKATEELERLRKELEETRQANNGVRGIAEAIAPAILGALGKSAFAQKYPMLQALGQLPPHEEVEQQHEPLAHSQEEEVVLKKGSDLEQQPKKDIDFKEEQRKAIAFNFFKSMQDSFERKEFEQVIAFIEAAKKDKSLLSKIQNTQSKTQETDAEV